MPEPSGLLGARALRAMLAETGIRPSRARGQHFVADPNTVRRIVTTAGVRAGDVVLEIGVGVGSLTVGLLAAGATVVGIEIDPRLCAVVRRHIRSDRLHLVEADAAHMDWEAFLGSDVPTPNKMVSNLPYSVGTRILLDVLGEVRSVMDLVVMVQREVADRLCAAPCSASYGATSVKVASLAQATSAGTVSRRVFVPEPEVTSALVVLSRHRESPADVCREQLWAVVDAGFAQRRKTLHKALGARWSPQVVALALTAAGVDGRRRAETLSLDEFAALAAALAAASDHD